MPWIVGIDEAGYGPNLGPLVQAAVAIHLPDGDHAGWKTLRPLVRRCGEEVDERLLIDDSKAVYTHYGFAALERGVTALAPKSSTVAELINRVGLAMCLDDLASEIWYDPPECLPVALTRDEWRETADRYGDRAHAAGVGRFDQMVASIVPTPRFNRVCDTCGTKAVVLSNGLAELIPATLGNLPSDGKPALYLCDKHGGRNYYAAMLQEAFPHGWIIPERESADVSRYRVELLDRPVTVTFRPRADGESVAVSLASMLCKYLRELCMHQFNRFWARHVPGIRPTAGYPGDAKRFFDEIRPAMSKLGLTEDQVWRKR
jgi:ribonuclease HII